MEPSNLYPKELIKALGKPKPPSTIWQKPFDYIPGHCQRIADQGFEASLQDILEYFLDYQYMEVQRDLFKFVLPIAFQAWAKTLLEPNRPFDGMWQAFDRRPPHPNYLSGTEFEALNSFVRRILFKRLQNESELSFRGSEASPYLWAEQFMNAVYVFPIIESLWTEWWMVDAPWKAICGLQWWSGFMYWRNESPIFGEWTREDGGGNICPYETSYLKYRPARVENIDFLKQHMSLSHAKKSILACCDFLAGTKYEAIAEEMRFDLEIQSDFLAMNIKKFLNLIQMKEGHQYLFWSDIPEELDSNALPAVVHLA